MYWRAMRQNLASSADVIHCDARVDCVETSLICSGLTVTLVVIEVPSIVSFSRRWKSDDEKASCDIVDRNSGSDVVDC